MPMKRFLISMFIGLACWSLLQGQLSFTDARLRDRAMNEGIGYILRGEYMLAEARLSECLEIDSTFAPAYLQRGRIWLEWGETEEAMRDLERALQFDPHLGEAYFYKGYILFGNDTAGRDAALFDTAIVQGFNDPWAFYFRALTEIRQGMSGRALNDLNQALELKRDFALAYHERAGIKRMAGDLQGAHFDYQTALEYQPDFPLAYQNMGSVKMLLGDYQGAIEDYSRALQLDPELSIALNNRGYARHFLGDEEGALQDFNDAVTEGDSMAVAVLNKASLMAVEHQYEGSLKLLDRILEHNPEEAVLYLNRGLIRELTGDLDGACEDWNRVQALGSRDADEYIKECSER
jgi:tetratricopeptide (TPR) repeat protein